MMSSDEHNKLKESEPLWIQNSDNVQKPDDRSWGDWVIKPGRNLNFRRTNESNGSH